MKRMKKILLTVAITLMICSVAVCFVACSGANDEQSIAPSGGGGSFTEDSSSSGTGIIVTTSDRLVVYTVDMGMSVEDIGKTVETIKQKLTAAGGWVAESRINEKSDYAYYVLRVPTDKLDEFVKAIEEGNELNSKSVTSVDITEQYVTAEEKKNALLSEKAEIEAWLAADASLSFDQKRELYARLTEIAEQVDRYTSEMSSYKKQADYSTINLYLYRKGTYVAPSYWDRLGEVLFGSGKSVGTVFGWLLTALVAILPYIGVVAVIFGLYVLIKFIVCKVKKVPFRLFVRARESAKVRKERKQRIIEAYEERDRRRNAPTRVSENKNAPAEEKTAPEVKEEEKPEGKPSDEENSVNSDGE